MQLLPKQFFDLCSHAFTAELTNTRRDDVARKPHFADMAETVGNPSRTKVVKHQPVDFMGHHLGHGSDSGGQHRRPTSQRLKRCNRHALVC